MPCERKLSLAHLCCSKPICLIIFRKQKVNFEECPQNESKRQQLKGSFSENIMDLTILLKLSDENKNLK